MKGLQDGIVREVQSGSRDGCSHRDTDLRRDKGLGHGIEPQDRNPRGLPVANSELERPLSPWLTVKEAAERGRCGPKLIYREVKAGRLRAARIGGRRELRLLSAWVDDWLIEQSTVREVR